MGLEIKAKIGKFNSFPWAWSQKFWIRGSHLAKTRDMACWNALSVRLVSIKEVKGISCSLWWILWNFVLHWTGFSYGTNTSALNKCGLLTFSPQVPNMYIDCGRNHLSVVCITVEVCLFQLVSPKGCVVEKFVKTERYIFERQAWEYSWFSCHMHRSQLKLTGFHITSSLWKALGSWKQWDRENTGSCQSVG
jgi:hypothetical protein